MDLDDDEDDVTSGVGEWHSVSNQEPKRTAGKGERTNSTQSPPRKQQRTNANIFEHFESDDEEEEDGFEEGEEDEEDDERDAGENDNKASSDSDEDDFMKGLEDDAHELAEDDNGDSSRYKKRKRRRGSRSKNNTKLVPAPSSPRTVAVASTHRASTIPGCRLDSDFASAWRKQPVADGELLSKGDDSKDDIELLNSNEDDQVKEVVPPATGVDVLSGRGTCFNQWEGNLKYLALVRKQMPAHEAAPYLQKSVIINQVRAKVQESGGRFLEASEDGSFTVMAAQSTYDKTRAAFRFWPSTSSPPRRVVPSGDCTCRTGSVVFPSSPAAVVGSALSI